MSIIVVWDLGLQLSHHFAFLFFNNSFRHWGLVLLSSWYAPCISLWFWLWSWLGFGCSLGGFLGLRCTAPDLIASPISLGALGAGAASSSSSSSSEECCSNSAMGSIFLHHLPLFLSFFPSATTDSLGAGFSGIFVEALAFGMGCLPAGL